MGRTKIGFLLPLALEESNLSSRERRYTQLCHDLEIRFGMGDDLSANVFWEYCAASEKEKKAFER